MFSVQTKNACHFSAWSACLLAHEMWRKAQLSGTEGLDEGVVGERGGEGEGMEEWIGRTQEVINSLKNGLFCHVHNYTYMYMACISTYNNNFVLINVYHENKHSYMRLFSPTCVYFHDYENFSFIIIIIL